MRSSRQIENLRERVEPHSDKFGHGKSRDGVSFWSSEPAGQHWKFGRMLRPPDGNRCAGEQE